MLKTIVDLSSGGTGCGQQPPGPEASLVFDEPTDGPKVHCCNLGSW